MWSQFSDRLTFFRLTRPHLCFKESRKTFLLKCCILKLTHRGKIPSQLFRQMLRAEMACRDFCKFQKCILTSLGDQRHLLDVLWPFTKRTASTSKEENWILGDVCKELGRSDSYVFLKHHNKWSGFWVYWYKKCMNSNQNIVKVVGSSGDLRIA